MKPIKKNSAFTLIELLTVIAIIGILAGILIPTVGAVRDSANKARTKTQFSQWATALDLFKQEYGYYPAVATSGEIDPAKFIGALSAATYTGTKITSPTDANLAGNKKRISFYSFSDADILKNESGVASEHITDAFGNTEDGGIACYFDTDGDGIISGTLKTVQGIDSSGSARPDLPSGGVRAGVIFYSAGKGGSSAAEAKKNIVTSW